MTFKEITNYLSWIVIVLALAVGWITAYDAVAKETVNDTDSNYSPTIISSEGSSYEAYFSIEYVVETRYYTDSVGAVVEYCILYNAPDSEWDDVEIPMDKETYDCLNYSINNPNSNAYEFVIWVHNETSTLLLVDKD